MGINLATRVNLFMHIYILLASWVVYYAPNLFQKTNRIGEREK